LSSFHVKVRKSRDIHNYDRRLRSVLDKIRTSESVKEGNKISILKFQPQCFAEGLAASRILKYIYSLLQIEKMLDRSFEKATGEDMVRIVEGIERNEKWSDWTKQDFKVTIKKFYRWLRGIQTRGFYPDSIL